MSHYANIYFFFRGRGRYICIIWKLLSRYVTKMHYWLTITPTVLWVEIIKHFRLKCLNNLERKKIVIMVQIKINMLFLYTFAFWVICLRILWSWEYTEVTFDYSIANNFFFHSRKWCFLTECDLCKFIISECFFKFTLVAPNYAHVYSEVNSFWQLDSGCDGQSYIHSFLLVLLDPFSHFWCSRETNKLLFYRK